MSMFKLRCDVDPDDMLMAWPSCDARYDRMCLEIILTASDPERATCAEVNLDHHKVADLIAYLGAWLVGAEP